MERYFIPYIRNIDMSSQCRPHKGKDVPRSWKPITKYECGFHRGNRKILPHKKYDNKFKKV